LANFFSPFVVLKVAMVTAYWAC